MPIATTLADITIASSRLAAGNASLGVPTPAPDASTLARAVELGDIVVISGTTGVLWARPGVGFWGVSHVYGLTATTWLALFKDLANALIARGQGAVPVRWTSSGVVAARTKTQFSITVKADKTYEYTANQALARLP